MAKRFGLSGSAWRRFAAGGPRRDGDSRRGSELQGRVAEQRAAWWLRLKGYRILGNRVRTPVGEIDLIASRAGTTCFIEVKHRPTVEDALYAVTPKQRERIEKAATWWLAQRVVGKAGTEPSRDIRFDVIAIVSGERPHHIPDAWRPEY